MSTIHAGATDTNLQLSTTPEPFYRCVSEMALVAGSRVGVVCMVCPSNYAAAQCPLERQITSGNGPRLSITGSQRPVHGWFTRGDKSLFHVPYVTMFYYCTLN